MKSSVSIYPGLTSDFFLFFYRFILLLISSLQINLIINNRCLCIYFLVKYSFSIDTGVFATSLRSYPRDEKLRSGQLPTTSEKYPLFT